MSTIVMGFDEGDGVGDDMDAVVDAECGWLGFCGVAGGRLRGRLVPSLSARSDCR